MPTPARVPTTWESLERLGKKAAQPASQAVADVAGDVKESLGISSSSGAGLGLEQSQRMPAGQKQQVKQADAARIGAIRQNIARINQLMMEARKKREQAFQAKQASQAEQVKQEKETVEKKEKQTVLAKMIKSRMGTKEGMQRASG